MNSLNSYNNIHRFAPKPSQNDLKMFPTEIHHHHHHHNDLKSSYLSSSSSSLQSSSTSSLVSLSNDSTWSYVLYLPLLHPQLFAEPLAQTPPQLLTKREMFYENFFTNLNANKNKSAQLLRRVQSNFEQLDDLNQRVDDTQFDSSYEEINRKVNDLISSCNDENDDSCSLTEDEEVSDSSSLNLSDNDENFNESSLSDSSIDASSNHSISSKLRFIAPRFERKWILQNQSSQPIEMPAIMHESFNSDISTTSSSASTSPKNIETEKTTTISFSNALLTKNNNINPRPPMANHNNKQRIYNNYGYNPSYSHPVVVAQNQNQFTSQNSNNFYNFKPRNGFKPQQNQAKFQNKPQMTRAYNNTYVNNIPNQNYYNKSQNPAYNTQQNQNQFYNNNKYRQSNNQSTVIIPPRLNVIRA